MTTGITAYEGPSGTVLKGALELPKEFDQTRFAAKWVKQGSSAERAKEPEIVASERVQIVGWQVWKSNKGQICRKLLASGPYVLMFRPKAVQSAANKIYGNVSRRRMLAEGEGKTVAGEMPDRGMLTNAMLAKKTDEISQPFEGPVALNNIAQEETEGPTEAVVSSEIKSKKK